jgi:hypothetical protein
MIDAGFPNFRVYARPLPLGAWHSAPSFLCFLSRSMPALLYTERVTKIAEGVELFKSDSGISPHGSNERLKSIPKMRRTPQNEKLNGLRFCQM